MRISRRATIAAVSLLSAVSLAARGGPGGPGRGGRAIILIYKSSSTASTLVPATSRGASTCSVL